jgi:hypothetical protein
MYGSRGDGVLLESAVALPTRFRFDDEQISTITCGDCFSAIITVTGKLYVVGAMRDDRGGPDAIHAEPFRMGPDDEYFVHVSIGSISFGCITQSNRLYMFGSGGSELCDGISEYHKLTNLGFSIPDVKMVTCISYNDDEEYGITYYINGNNDVFKCGRNVRYPIYVTNNATMMLGDEFISVFMSADGNASARGGLNGLLDETTDIQRLTFNGGTPISCGAVGEEFAVFVINSMDDQLLQISAMCSGCGKVEAKYFASDYSGVYCGQECAGNF